MTAVTADTAPRAVDVLPVTPPTEPVTIAVDTVIGRIELTDSEGRFDNLTAAQLDSIAEKIRRSVDAIAHEERRRSGMKLAVAR